MQIPELVVRNKGEVKNFLLLTQKQDFVLVERLKKNILEVKT